VAIDKFMAALGGRLWSLRRATADHPAAGRREEENSQAAPGLEGRGDPAVPARSHRGEHGRMRAAGTISRLRQEA